MVLEKEMSLLKAHELHAQMHEKGWAQQKPNTETDTHSTDNLDNFELGGVSKHFLSKGVTQTTDWLKTPFTYKWNSLGLRGPEPNPSADRKMLVIGNSLTLAQGVPEECGMVRLLSDILGYDYVNLSEFFVLTDCIEQLTKITKTYKPSIVLIFTGRFISGMDMMTSYSLKQLDKFKEETLRKNAVNVMGHTSGQIINMFETVVKYNCPDAKYYWVMPSKENVRPRDPYYAPGVWSQSNFQKIEMNLKELVVDLGRDNQHPGIESHKLIANHICNFIK